MIISKKLGFLILIPILIILIYFMLSFNIQKNYIYAKCLFSENLLEKDINNVFNITFVEPMIIQKKVFEFGYQHKSIIYINDKNNNILINDHLFVNNRNFVVINNKEVVLAMSCNHINDYTILKFKKNSIQGIDFINKNNFSLSR
jgi:hypothetical protein